MQKNVLHVRSAGGKRARDFCANAMKFGLSRAVGESLLLPLFSAVFAPYEFRKKNHLEDVETA
jgi:hypothetical protein